MRELSGAAEAAAEGGAASEAAEGGGGGTPAGQALRCRYIMGK